MVACWAHNPKVVGSKPTLANLYFLTYIESSTIPCSPMVRIFRFHRRDRGSIPRMGTKLIYSVFVAQWLAHLPSKQGVAGSSPAKDKLGAAIYYAT